MIKNSQIQIIDFNQNSKNEEELILSNSSLDENKPHIVEKIEERMNSERSTMLLKLFKIYDLDQDDFLDYESLRKLLEDNCSKRYHERFVKQMMLQFRTSENDKMLSSIGFVRMIEGLEIPIILHESHNIEKENNVKIMSEQQKRTSPLLKDQPKLRDNIVEEQQNAYDPKQSVYYDLFLQYDKDRDGQLNFDEFKQLLLENAAVRYHERFMKQLLLQYEDQPNIQKIGVQNLEKLIKQQQIQIRTVKNDGYFMNQSLIGQPQAKSAYDVSKQNNIEQQNIEQKEKITILSERQIQLSNLFNKYDLDSDKLLDFYDFKKLLEENSNKKYPDRFIKQMMQQQANGTSKIDILSFVRLAQEQSIPIVFESRTQISSEQLQPKLESHKQNDRQRPDYTQISSQQQTRQSPLLYRNEEVIKDRKQTILSEQQSAFIPKLSRYYNVFLHFDVDQDGYLNYEELRQLLLERSSTRFHDSHIKYLIQQYEDYANLNKISLRQFEQMVKQRQIAIENEDSQRNEKPQLKQKPQQILSQINVDRHNEVMEAKQHDTIELQQNHNTEYNIEYNEHKNNQNEIQVNEKDYQGQQDENKIYTKQIGDSDQNTDNQYHYQQSVNSQKQDSHEHNDIRRKDEQNYQQILRNYPNEQNNQDYGTDVNEQKGENNWHQQNQDDSKENQKYQDQNYQDKQKENLYHQNQNQTQNQPTHASDPAPQPRRQLLQDLFFQYDTSQAGKLRFEQLKTLLSQHYYKRLSDRQIQNLVSQFQDKDLDNAVSLRKFQELADQIELLV